MGDGFSERDEGFPRTMALTPDKPVRWKRISDDIARERSVAQAEIEDLIGRLGWAKSGVFVDSAALRFNRCMRNCIPPLLFGYSRTET